MRAALLILGLSLLLRLPFLNQAVQGDDVNYIALAQYAQTDPLHPLHAKYVFNGESIDMRGQPHPPLNAWILAGLLALMGDINEVRYHAVYIAFTFLALLSVWSLARRFCDRPVWALLLFAGVPAFVVNGNSFEPDMPSLAFWLAASALWVIAVDLGSAAWLIASGTALAIAAMGAYQSVALIPILGLYLWMHRRQWMAGWAVLLTPAFILIAWQGWERLSSGAMPATVLTGYFFSHGLQTLENKGRNAVALIVHLAWIVCPLLLWRKRPRPHLILMAIAAICGALLDWNPLFWVSFALGIGMLAELATTLGGERNDEWFLSAWVLLFFGFAICVFFAGSARYLLPIAAPVVILTARRSRMLAAGCLLGFALSFSLAWVNYQHWDGYRSFVASVKKTTQRIWINGEWGLRYYGEADGGLPVIRGQAVRPGDLIISSKLAMPVEFNSGGGTLVPVAEQPITASLPFRLIALDTRSGYSAATLGFRPFDISTSPIDIVTAKTVVERKPTLSYLPMNSPEAEAHIVSGIYALEQGNWRWTGARAVALLKSPSAPAPLVAEFRLHGESAGREVTIALDGLVVAKQRYPNADLFTLRSPPIMPKGPFAAVTVSIDKTFRVPGDQRELGLILVGVGFQ